MNPQVTFRETAIVKKQEYLYYFCSNKVLYMQCYRCESGIYSQWHRKKRLFKNWVLLKDMAIRTLRAYFLFQLLNVAKSISIFSSTYIFADLQFFSWIFWKSKMFWFNTLEFKRIHKPPLSVQSVWRLFT